MDDDQLERIEQLERSMRRLEADLAALHDAVERDVAQRPNAQWNRPGWQPATEAFTSWPAPTPVASAPTADRPTRERTLVLESETVLKWGGVGLVVLAVGFAVSTAISRGWIGPELQLVGAVGVSLALIGTGLRLRPTRRAWTHALCVGGVASLYTTVASDLFLDQATDDIAFISTAVIGFGGLLLARFVPSEWIAAATSIGGMVGWFVIADGELPFHASVAWVVVFGAAAVALALEQRWFALRFVAHGLALFELIAVANRADQSVQQSLVLVAAALLASSLVRIPSIGDLTSVWQQLEIQLSTFAAPWAFAMIAITLDLDGDNVVGTTAIAVATGAALVAWGLRRLIQQSHLLSIVIGASVTLSIGLAILLSTLLSTTVAFVALGVQGAGLVVLGRSFGGSVRVMINAAILVLVATVFVVVNMVDAWADDASVGDDISNFVIIAAVAIAAWLSGVHLVRWIGALTVLALVLLWLGSVLVHLPQGQAVVSVSWAVIGTAVLVAGAIRKVPELGAAGLAVLAVTVAKLLTVDLREVDTLWRAGLFFVVGIGFLRLGFLLPRLTRDDAGAETS